MTQEQWEKLISVINGEILDPLPTGFIIDSPWLPNWAGYSILDYFTSGSIWQRANIKAIETFPEIMFLPGFWSEYGMCTEPSAFGAKCIWYENEFPFADKVISDPQAAAALAKPDPRQDGLLPFMLKRLQQQQSTIAQNGHAIRFAVARGPLNIATFLMGGTEFMMGLHTNPEEMHKLLKTVSDFLVDWLQVQAEAFSTIKGVMILDDPVGFVGQNDFEQFALPYLKQVFSAIDADVRFFHNDARGQVCAPYLPEIGVNLFNFAYEHSLAEMKEWTRNQVALLGNIPPRDVLANGSPADVQQAVSQAIASVDDKSRIVLSCGGGMPPGVTTENIEAFLKAAGYRN
jgi:uroporphyrinogen decarboxylase